MKKLQHGQLLDAKLIMDGPIGILYDIRRLVPEVLNSKFQSILDEFQSELAHCDVADRFEEIKC